MVKRFKQESAHRQTDGNTDATTCTIAPATRSINITAITCIHQHNQTTVMYVQHCPHNITAVPTTTQPSIHCQTEE